ncbi:hypothetical protein IFM89_005950 [Coptis chinensis]|uniref:Myb-like domain-containing protein n=1 Tax=Coptis chinensis TaxID=261450 RepID=A0A835M404_9MAGN|nr:hypothetical protein IFM89_005950 [Coptis chinensis]
MELRMKKNKVEKKAIEIKAERAKENGECSEIKKSFRRRRSKAAPNWTLGEMFVLVNEVATVESDSTKTISKWKHISDNCNALGVSRSLNQCRRKWELLFDQYSRIKDWEMQSRVVSYWSLDCDSQLELQLPLLFDKDLFGSIEEAVQAQEETDTDSDPNFTLTKSGLKKKRRWQIPRESKNDEKDDEMAVKLREQARLVHAILRGDPECSSYSDMKGPGESQLEFKRWQGNELIKVLGSLNGIIDQLSDLVQDGG